MKEKFVEWLNKNLKCNSSLLTGAQYEEIVRYLKSENKRGFERKLKSWVDNKYQLLGFPVFGEDVLCVEKKNEVSDFYGYCSVYVAVNYGYVNSC